MATNRTDRLAVLVDADNAQSTLAELLLAEISRYGTATVKRAYGDWTTPNLKGWKEILNRLAIQPVQQFRYTSGKNATDSALIIDAMDLLHSGNVDGFCLISSDSDFTRLATRIREAGIRVYGFGESKTPEPFVSACDKFVFTEILRSDASAPPPSVTSSAPSLEEILMPAVVAAAREDGWSPLSTVGSLIAKTHSAFDSRNYGFAKLGELVRKHSFIETKDVAAPDGSSSLQVFVRPREKARR